jgi:DNA-directed RNA polymerase specialized sigma24 family protein
MSRSIDAMRPEQKGAGGYGLSGPLRTSVPAEWNWEELNSAYRPRLIAAGIVRFSLTREECEDAAQTVFVKVIAQNPRVRDPKAYLRAAFLHQAQNVAEARSRSRARMTELDPDGIYRSAIFDPEERERQAEKIRRITAVTGAFKRVGDKCQRVIRCYCIDDCSLAETAEKRVQECLKRMRQCLA